MTRKENILRAIRFEKPDYIPMIFAINSACWHHDDQEGLKDLIESHKFLFPDYQRPEGKVEPDYGVTARKDVPYTDSWGCVWETTDDGIVGSVHQHPLASWDDFASYQAPDPNETNGTNPIDWDKIKVNTLRARENGELIGGGLPHGHTFLRLQDIRGYENLLFDMFDEEPNLPKLIGMVEEFNYQYVMKWLELKPDIMSYPEDLGMQVGPMISPDYLRKYIKPVYKRVMQPARDQGCIVHMHSDGDIRDLVDEDRKSTRLNSSHIPLSRMPSSA